MPLRGKALVKRGNCLERESWEEGRMPSGLGRDRGQEVEFRGELASGKRMYSALERGKRKSWIDYWRRRCWWGPGQPLPGVWAFF